MINKLLIIIIFTCLLVLGIGTVRAKVGRVDFNCSDFENQKQAQSLFDQNPKDIYRLDKNHNGVACESLPKGV